MTNSIKVNLLKIQGAKTVDFGEPYGELTVRPLGSNESLEINSITRESIKIIDELMGLQSFIQSTDLSTLKDDDKEALEKVERGNELLAERERLAARELEIYSKCFALSDREKGMDILNSLNSMAIQELFVDIFSKNRESRRKAKD